jgi:exonuclease SbcD
VTSLRFLHTADWHLGRLFHGLHLTDDQAFVLEEFVAMARDVRPDFIVVAGDVYDRAVPPPDAVALLDDVLSRLVLDAAIPTIVIAGNHDSPDRLGFGARVLAERGLHVSGALRSEFRPLIFDAEGWRLAVAPLPYAEPATVRDRVEGCEASSHNEAMAALVARARAVMPSGARRLAVAHAFVAGAAESDSERPLSVGGSAGVDAAVFADFDYTALGHLHRPQRAGSDRVRYAGSLLKYSFAEADHTKSVALVELAGDGAVRVEEIALTPRRDVRRLQGSLAELLTGPPPGVGRQDYVEAVLTDREAIFDAIGKLRAVYPNCLRVDRRAFFERGMEAADTRFDHRGKTRMELFDLFWREVTGEAPSDAERELLEEVLRTSEAGERQA